MIFGFWDCLLDRVVDEEHIAFPAFEGRNGPSGADSGRMADEEREQKWKRT